MFMKRTAQSFWRWHLIRAVPAHGAGKAAERAASRPTWPCPAAVSGRRVGVWSVSLISADRIPGPAALHKPTVGPLSQRAHRWEAVSPNKFLPQTLSGTQLKSHLPSTKRNKSRSRGMSVKHNVGKCLQAILLPSLPLSP